MRAFGFGPAFTAWSRRPETRIAVTGATGWLGSAFIHAAVEAGLLQDDKRLRLFGSTPRDVTLAGQRLFVERLADAEPLAEGEWLLAHFAFLGKERTSDLTATDFAAANRSILYDMQALAGDADALRVVFSSSGAVYDAARDLVGPDAEPYGAQKVVHEREIARWCSARDFPLVITRVFNLGGPFINKQNLYALASIVQALLDGTPVLLRADRPVLRTFLHVQELCAVLAEAAVLADTRAPTVFDAAGEEVVELSELAAVAAEVLGRPLAVERRWDPGAPSSFYLGDPSAYHDRVSAMGWEVCDLRTIVADTAQWIGTRD